MADDSVLILDEVVMPLLGVSWKQASMDLAMMTMLAAKERTESDFVELFKAANLKIREIRTYDEDYGDSLIIAELITKAGEKSEESKTNGGATKSAETNGVHTNGVETNGAHTNGDETNGVQTNGDGTNGVHENAVEESGLHTNGVETQETNVEATNGN